MPCRVPVPCLRRAYAGGRATRAHPPPPRPHLPHPPRTEARATARWRGDKRDDGSGRRTPPRGRRGGVERQRGETTVPKGGTRRASPHGGTAGGATAGRVGRRRGPHGNPPPPAEGQVPSLVPAPCFQRACAKGRTARTPPPPRPLLRRPPAERARAARRQWEKKKKKKKKKTHKASNQGHQHAGARTGSRGRRDMAGARGHSKGPGSAPLGMKEGEQGPTGGGGVTRAREQRW